MTRQDKFPAAKSIGSEAGVSICSPVVGASANTIGTEFAGLPCKQHGKGQTGEAGVPNLSALIAADASKVSPRGFLDALGLSSPELREARRERDRQACIRAIRRGDVFGFPPSLVAECRHIMAMQSEVRL